MKLLHLATFLFSLSVTTSAQAAAPREIKVHTEKKNEVIHWMPETIEVIEGEIVNFQVSHDVEGGFDFHGFQIPDLKIEKSIDRGKPQTFPVKITLKPGSYDIGCQFHPKHQKAKLVVLPKKTVPKKIDPNAVSPVKKPGN